MPAISIIRNGELLCRIGSTGLDVININVSGNGSAEGPVLLDASGGSFAGCNCDEAMIWELGRALRAGDRLLLAFSDEKGSSRPSQSLFEAVTGVSEEQRLPAAGDAAAISAFEQRPLLHPNLAFAVAAPGEPIVTGGLAEGRPLLSLSIMWQARRPDIARLHLRNRSLRETLAHNDGEKLLSRRMALGNQVEVSILA